MARQEHEWSAEMFVVMASTLSGCREQNSYSCSAGNGAEGGMPQWRVNVAGMLVEGRFSRADGVAG
eukprot:18248-Pelagomonas_calceolata.AAC.1